MNEGSSQGSVHYPTKGFILALGRSLVTAVETFSQLHFISCSDLEIY